MGLSCGNASTWISLAMMFGKKNPKIFFFLKWLGLILGIHRKTKGLLASHCSSGCNPGWGNWSSALGMPNENLSRGYVGPCLNTGKTMEYMKVKTRVSFIK